MGGGSEGGRRFFSPMGSLGRHCVSVDAEALMANLWSARSRSGQLAGQEPKRRHFLTFVGGRRAVIAADGQTLIPPEPRTFGFDVRLVARFNSSSIRHFFAWRYPVMVVDSLPEPAMADYDWGRPLRHQEWRVEGHKNSVPTGLYSRWRSSRLCEQDNCESARSSWRHPSRGETGRK